MATCTVSLKQETVLLSPSLNEDYNAEWSNEISRKEFQRKFSLWHASSKSLKAFLGHWANVNLMLQSVTEKVCQITVCNAHIFKTGSSVHQGLYVSEMAAWRKKLKFSQKLGGQAWKAKIFVAHHHGPSLYRGL